MGVADGTAWFEVRARAAAHNLPTQNAKMSSIFAVTAYQTGAVCRKAVNGTP